jgi:hypothetical protein
MDSIVLVQDSFKITQDLDQKPDFNSKSIIHNLKLPFSIPRQKKRLK